MAKITVFPRNLQRSASELMTDISKKSKINLSYDPIEYILSVAYSIGQLTYFVCMVELFSYFTLQLEETAYTVYDSSISLCVAHIQ